ncbi:FAD-binding dehydrogenase [Dietzia sp.]|uniref:FAD-binding dehydrogenase n=1 Tax=Dietzia sp. TaxID=1871616 RepID=UPI002FDACE86
MSSSENANDRPRAELSASSTGPTDEQRKHNAEQYDEFLAERPTAPEYAAYVETTRSTAANAGPLPRIDGEKCRGAESAEFVPDLIVVGAGLAGLVATYEATKAGKRVLVLDQENENSLGGQAYWSLGGLFLVDSPEQRHIGIHDSFDLAWRDWQGSAAFDRPEDEWPRSWAREYVAFAAGEKRQYLHDLGLRFVPTVGWAERGSGDAEGHGNSVPRFHVSKGTGTDVVRIFEEPVREAAARGLVRFGFRHRVGELLLDDGVVVGVSGAVLSPCDELDRSVASPRTEVGEFEFRAAAVLVSSGGIGGNPEKVAELWPTERLGPAPGRMISGVPEHVDGKMIDIAAGSGARAINRDRMWNYTEGVRNFAPVWPRHAIRIIPGPSTIWLDAFGQRMPIPLFPGFDTVASTRAITDTGHHYSWFVLDEAIAAKEYLLSGSEQNPDITSKKLSKMLGRIVEGMPPGVEGFVENGPDWVTAETIEDLVAKMNGLLEPGEPTLEVEDVRRHVLAIDGQMDNPFAKDAQVQAIHNSRRVITDRLARIAKPHKLLKDSGAGTHSWAGEGGPLIAVKIHLMTRKTLGGLETDLDSRCLGADGEPIPGLYAAGEAAGFGGGGVHGYSSLEGTFLGGCIFSGMRAGRAVARS